MNILDEIVAYKRIEVKEQKSRIPFKALEQTSLFERKILSLEDSLKNTSKTSIITEFKKKSPSRGIINDEATPELVTKGYADAGAAGLSVLTDNKYFGGSPEDLIKAREVNEIPILRKDFTVDEYQIIQSKAIGADAILLIAACLSNQQLKEFARTAKSLGLQVIMEIHKLSELSLLNEFVDIVGVNNRNLKTFEVDINTSIELIKHIPSEFVRISESGISSARNIIKLRECGYDGFLIGEFFMKEKDPVKAFIKFVRKLETDNKNE